MVNASYPSPAIKNLDGCLARSSHLDFMLQTWQRPRQPMLVGRHTRSICAIIDDAVKKYREGISSYLMIKVPFRHGKSDMVSRYLPPHFIGEFPDDEVLMASYGSDLVRGFSRFSRALIQSKEYQDIYQNIKLSKTERSVDNWGLEDEVGHVYWTGLGGTITGRGGSCIVVDDFFKGREEAESPTIRDKVWECLKNDIFTRAAPTCIFIIMATPWHVDDPFGRIEKEMAANPEFPRFQNVIFPAFDSSYGGDGTLFPERFNAAWYRAEKAVLGTYGTASLLQCSPKLRTGNRIRVDKMMFYDDLPGDVVCARGWDLASSEAQVISDDPDYTVGIKVGARWLPTAIPGEMIPVFFIDDIVRGRWEAPKRNRVIRDTAMADGYIAQGIEGFGAYKDAYTTVAKVLKGIRTVKKSQLPGDKVTKWDLVAPAFEAGNVWFSNKIPMEIREAFIKEVSEAPGSAHDDFLDGLVVAVDSLGTNTKKVLPSYNSVNEDRSNFRSFALLWDTSKIPVNTCLHYGAMSLEDDLTLHIMGAIWDEIGGLLYIYMDAVTSDLVPDKIVRYLVSAMHLNEFYFERFLSNDKMRSDGQKSQTAVINKSFAKFVPHQTIKLREPGAYDPYGSLALANQLIDARRLIVHTDCSGTNYALKEWIVEKGKMKFTGQCENLMMIVSELRKKSLVQKKAFLKDWVDGGRAHFTASGY